MKSLIFIGLQNNFKQYQNTRHNAGSIVLKELEVNLPKANFPHPISFYYSPTYMNLSGEILYKIKKENNLKQSEEYKNIFVFCDDVNISLGDFKISFAEGASSQNGIKSVVEKLGSKNFYRVRIGIGKKQFLENGKSINWRPEPDEMSDYVLSNFSQTEVSNIGYLNLFSRSR
jgi:PTH1 family peptidyl-tRNA hydrolase